MSDEIDTTRCITLEPPNQEYRGIMLCGEAPGETEQDTGRCFVGVAGKLLDDLLQMAGIKREACVVTNVFHCRPPYNRVSEFFTKKEDESDYPNWPMGHTAVRFLRKELTPEIKRLAHETKTWHPKIIVALGNIALWALTGKSGITVHHGKLINSDDWRVMPVFHPAYLMRIHSQTANAEVVKALFEVRKLTEAPGS